ncbi:MAG: polysaccharide deacetylase family protein [Candidatus Eiseniibacteriota bacterium]|nr:MAG: polysaccharide deacetylase family protein [Candidatus Eisenbacteria bacterium]
MKSMKLADVLGVINALKNRHGIGPGIGHNVSESQLYELKESGVFTVGAHTLNHPILSNESDDDAEIEIRESIGQLSTMLNTDVRYFSYPNGTSLDFGTREQTMARRYGIRIAVTEHIDFFRKDCEPLSVPRAAFSATGSAVNRGILMKLLLLPVWEPLRASLGLRRTEIGERREIKERALFRPESAAEQS